MPTYSYKCTDCGHRFDKEQRITESPLKECPVCAGHVRRVISQVGVVFKGTGFYVTDNRNGSNAKVKTEKKSEGTEATGSGEAAATTSTTSTEKTPAPAATTTTAA